MKPECKEGIERLEKVLERPMSQHEKDLYEFAYAKGYKRAKAESGSTVFCGRMPKRPRIEL